MPKKLLIVEDDPDIRRLFSLVFEEAGYEVLTAEDGVAGLRMTKKEWDPLESTCRHASLSIL